MGRATRTELLWAFAITREEFLKRVNDKIELHSKEWEDIRDTLFEAMSKGETSIYEPKMNAYLEDTIYKYLRPADEPISLTDIARRYEPDNPSYLIQIWLRSRNTIEFLGEWERNNNKQFNEEAFQKLLKDVRSPSYTLTPKRWIETVNPIGIESKRGKNGGTMAHPFIACDIEMWNDMHFRYVVVQSFLKKKLNKNVVAVIFKPKEKNRCPVH